MGFLILILMVVPLVSSQTYKINSVIDLKIPTNASSCNVTVTFPNSTNVIYNQTMSTFNTGYANYTFTNSLLNGEYDYYSNCGSGYIQVTGNGDVLTTPMALLYSLIWIVCFLMFVGLLIYGIAADGNNKRDEMTGYVLDVSNVKYLKIFSLAFCYVILLFLSYFTWMICFAYLDFAFIASIFQFIFYGMAGLTLPLFILFVYLLIANAIRDSKIKEELGRGLRVK